MNEKRKYISKGTLPKSNSQGPIMICVPKAKTWFCFVGLLDVQEPEKEEWVMEEEIQKNVVVENAQEPVVVEDLLEVPKLQKVVAPQSSEPEADAEQIPSS